MKQTIPLPIPVPTIEINGNEVKINREATELAKMARERGQVLTIDKEKSSPLCCACKRPQAHMATLEPPIGFLIGGWFCGYCLGQGEIASNLGLVIDQLTCDIIPRAAFDKHANFISSDIDI